jgi:hypothetical protein
MPSKATVCLTCQVCGKEFMVPPFRADKAKACSKACGAIQRARTQTRQVTKTCPHCRREFSIPASHEGRRTYCSRKCQKASPEFRELCSISKVGADNPAWRGGKARRANRRHSVGHGHPFAVDGRLLEHRWAMEEHLRSTDPGSPFLVKLGNQLYLSPEFEVHHKDLNYLNNSPSNLECLTSSEHRKLHNDLRRNA